jgi:hypothetical protein
LLWRYTFLFLFLQYFKNKSYIKYISKAVFSQCNWYALCSFFFNIMLYLWWIFPAFCRILVPSSSGLSSAINIFPQWHTHKWLLSYSEVLRHSKNLSDGLVECIFQDNSTFIKLFGAPTASPHLISSKYAYQLLAIQPAT